MAARSRIAFRWRRDGRERRRRRRRRMTATAATAAPPSGSSRRFFRTLSRTAVPGGCCSALFGAFLSLVHLHFFFFSGRRNGCSGQRKAAKCHSKGPSLFKKCVIHLNMRLAEQQRQQQQHGLRAACALIKGWRRSAAVCEMPGIPVSS